MRFSICLFIGSLVLASCQRQTVTGVEVDSKLKGYILLHSKVLAGVSLEKIRQTDFYRRHAEQLTFPQLDQLSDEIGMDPRRQLSSVLMMWDGAETLFVIRGRFSQSQIEEHLQSHSVVAEKYNKFKLYGDAKREIALVPSSMAVIGAPVVLRKALDSNSTGAGNVPEDLQLRLARLSNGAQVWLVSNGVIPLGQLSMRSDAATALANISDYVNATAFGFTVGSGLSVDVHISCISEEGAKRVHDALRGVIGLARLSTQDNQLEQLKIWDSIYVEKQGTDVHVTSKLEAGLADKLMSMAPALSKRF